MKPIWRRRLDLVNLIYSDQLNPIEKEESTKQMEIEEFEEWMKEVFAYYKTNRNEIKDLISSHLKEGWFWNRLNPYDKAIMLQSYCEYKIKKTEKAILISEALKNIKNFSDENSKAYVHAILDKILK